MSNEKPLSASELLQWRTDARTGCASSTYIEKRLDATIAQLREELAQAKDKLKFESVPISVVQACIDQIEEKNAQITKLRDALTAFVEAWEKSHQLEKTDVALRLARAALTDPEQPKEEK